MGVCASGFVELCEAGLEAAGQAATAFWAIEADGDVTSLHGGAVCGGVDAFFADHGPVDSAAN